MSYRDLILADSPALYWPLDSTYGATDQSGNSRNGTGAGGISIGGFSSSPISGETTSTDFDGSDDHLTSTYKYAALSVFTFSAWLYRDTNAANQHVFQADQNQAPGLRFPSGAQNVVWRPISNSTTGEITWSNAFPGNTTWAMLTFSFNTGTGNGSLYINGAFVSTQNTATAYGGTPATANFLLGRLNTVSPWDGKMAHIAVWERALTASEIQSHYQAGLGAGAVATKNYQHQAGGVQ